MAYNIISTNLNVWGGRGNFETDRSTWGFNNPSGSPAPHIYDRNSSFKTKDNYSCRTLIVSAPTAFSNYRTICPAQFSMEAGKTYLAKCKVRGSASPNTLAADAAEIRINTPLGTGITVIDNRAVTAADINAQFQDVELLFTATTTNSKQSIFLQVTGEANINVNGAAYTDEFEIYEVEYTCNIGINIANSSDTSLPGASDGFIVADYTGDIAGTPEYSIDGGATWLPPSADTFRTFNTLSSGTYTILVRDSLQPSCTASTTHVVNDPAIAFSFTTVVTDETVDGLDDGTVTVNVSGGTGPFQFRMEGTAGTVFSIPWQGSNVINSLPSGFFNLFVQDTNNSEVISTLIQIRPGSFPFDFTTSVVNETVSGAGNGRITVTVTGSGTPFEYSISKANPFVYQSSNQFTNLDPGTYQVTVKNTNDVTLTKSVVVAAGPVLFDDIVFSENWIPFTLAQTANASEENYKIYNAVLAKGMDENTFTQAIASALPPDAAGQATFNNRPALRGLFNIQPPTTADSKVREITDSIKLIKNKYGDIFNALTVPASFTESNDYLVLYGGLDKLRYPDIDFFNTYLPAKKIFLSWSPASQVVDINQEQFLSLFVFDPSVTQVRRQLRAYYDDQSTENATSIPSNSGTLYGKVFRALAGPTHSGATIIAPEKTLTKYEIWFTDQDNNIISETKTFTLSSFRPPTTRYLLFLNSLGGWDVLRMTGKTTEQVMIESQMVEKHLDYDYAALDGQYNTINHSRQTMFQYSTGFYSGKYGKQMAEYLQEVVLSDKVYDITTGERVPILIQPGTFQIDQAENYQYFMRFNAMSAYKDEVFTPKTLP